MFTTHPSVLTVTIVQVLIAQAIVAASTSMIDGAVTGTQYRQCHSRIVRRKTKDALSLTVALAASSLLQVKTPLTVSPPPPPRNHKIQSRIEEHPRIKLYWSCPFNAGWVLVFGLMGSCHCCRWSRFNRASNRRRRSFFT
jgi:hypothetical protein